ncbi:succinylglutamate desuccinylase [Halomonas sp. ISL-60]|uniref:succinylglutamate desuccinylase n=1 Tax=Halomonas sp. ISL-56 TaxID=2819149 RepID=UPI001BECED85|nr:succinylglutamate desuccinylase [Halomonas sp. ISL-56]MBT2772159.1 succinylglutamate desuccinylase [Halomonas sp. ISL-60]MBT2803770.1 succinylglutamate desuccinylase [Halomonas sp. ISL-56]
MLGQWLDWSLDGQLPAASQGVFASGAYHLRAPGILELIPNTQSQYARACIFSAAIHGNETAPVELLGEWLSGLEAGSLKLGAPVLVILGNLPALKAQQRFLATNLNRLFNRELTVKGEEPNRARELMAAVDGFYARHAELPKLHYDLHTAIRDSRYTRFVVEPYADVPTDAEQWGWLAAAGMQAVLHQHQHSWTFSHYSKHYHAAQAFTFELGRVAPFGQNDMASLKPMRALLSALSEGRAPPSQPATQMQFFQVHHELIRHSDDFQLCFADDTANFSRFEPGTLLALDAKTGEFRVGDMPLYVVFPNAQVEVGARAALLVAPIA